MAAGASLPLSGASPRLLHSVGGTSISQQDAVVIPCELMDGVLAGYVTDWCNLRLCSDSFVYRWHASSSSSHRMGADIYVKAQRLANARDPPVSREAEIMRWLHKTHQTLATETLPVPKVLAEVTQGGAGFIATQALIGSNSHTRVKQDSPRDEVAATVRSNAIALRRLHDSVKIADCPFQCDVASEIAAARQRLRARALPLDEWYAHLQAHTLVSSFCSLSHPNLIYRGTWQRLSYSEHSDSRRRELAHTPEEELQKLELLSDSMDEDLVFTHGDYCAPNVLVGDEPMHPVTGIVDWGYAGVADRWRDIVKAVWSVEFNFGTGWKEEWMSSYGVEDNVEKAEFYDRLTAFL